jgi:hypothetical protein
MMFANTTEHMLARAGPRNGTLLALMMRLTSSGVQLGSQWRAIACGATLAVKHANARDGRIVPQLATIPENVPKITALMMDSRSNELGGITAYRAALAAGAAAIVGPAKSLTSKAIGPLANVDRMPLMSFWASAPELADNRLCTLATAQSEICCPRRVTSHFCAAVRADGTYSRTYPSDVNPLESIAEYVRGQGWRFISVVHVHDTRAHAYRTAFGVVAQRVGVTVQRTASFVSRDVASQHAALASLQEPDQDGAPAPNIIRTHAAATTRNQRT